MMKTTKHPITRAMKGLLMGLAAFLAGLIPEMGLARVTDQYLFLFLFVAGFVLLKFSMGSQLTWSRLLIGSISGMVIAGMGYFIILSLALITMHEHSEFSFFNYLLPVVVYGAFGITFGLVNFGGRSLRVFTSVFVGFSIALTLILLQFQATPLLPEQFADRVLTLTKIPFQYLFVYLTLGALLGLSIGLLRQASPSGEKAIPTEDPGVASLHDEKERRDGP